MLRVLIVAMYLLIIVVTGICAGYGFTTIVEDWANAEHQRKVDNSRILIQSADTTGKHKCQINKLYASYNKNDGPYLEFDNVKFASWCRVTRIYKNGDVK